MSINRYACPCCGYKTLTQKPSGTYEICDVCFWEDDGVQFDDPDYEGGANQESLRTAQKNFLDQFLDEKGEMGKLPLQIEGYVFEGAKDVSKISRMPIIEMIKIFRAIDSPIDKVLDIYGGTIDIINSNYVYNTDELSIFLSEDDIEDYLILTRRKSFVKVPDGEGHINELINLSDDMAEEKIQKIKVRFVNAVREKWENDLSFIDDFLGC